VQLIGVEPGCLLVAEMQAGVEAFSDVGNGFVKSVVFGVICAFIAVFVGYEAKPTPEGCRARRPPRWSPPRWRCCCSISS
jgi:phospholipid/cholesterol/gamma-HCH transport system permease protein